MNILADAISPSSLHLRSFMSSKTSLLTRIPENFNSDFNFTFDLTFSQIVFFPALYYLW